MVPRRLVIAALAAAAVTAAGCGTGSPRQLSHPRLRHRPPAARPTSPPARTTTTPATSTAAQTQPGTTLTVFLLHGGALGAVHRTVPHTLGVARASLEQLLDGPTAAEARQGYTTAIPAGTRLRAIALDGGTATVDLSGGFRGGGAEASLRVAQVVYTATQFPTVRNVQLELDGAPLGPAQGRADLDAQAPAILLDTPVSGEQAACPLHVAGSADTFEASLTLELRAADGTLLARRGVTATSGSGVRGSFDVHVPCSAHGQATLSAYEPSAEDGSPTHRVDVPLVLR